MNQAHPRIVATIEARMTSSRLPGKILLEANGRPMLGHLFDRLRLVPSLSAIVLATTTNDTDDPVVAFAKQEGIACYRGSEHDVMSRVIGAAESVQADIIAEITADCPVIDPSIVEQCVRMYLHNKCEYLSNGDIPGYPDGMCLPVLSLESLRKSSKMTTALPDREHVTLHIRNHPEMFRPVYLVPPLELHWPELGLTLDEEADYLLLKRIIEHFAPRSDYSLAEILDALRTNENWLSINQHVVRKAIPQRGTY